jgi:hypothetical protein
MTRAEELANLSDWLSVRRDALPAGSPEAAGDQLLDDAIRRHLEIAWRAARPGRRRVQLLQHADMERAFLSLDAAEADLVRRVPLEYLPGMLPGVYARVRRHLSPDDPLRIRIEQLAAEARRGPLDDTAHEAVVSAVDAANTAARREHARVESFQHVLYFTALALTLLAIVVAVVGWTAPQAVPLCFEPENSVVCPAGASTLDPGEDVDDVVRATVSSFDLLLVQCLGLAAAAVTGATTLRRVRGTSTPYAIPVALAVLKLPTGALTAVLGLLLMRGGFVPGLSALDSSAQILGWAVLFGGAQQLFTGVVDRQAQSVLDSVGGKAHGGGEE